MQPIEWQGCPPCTLVVTKSNVWEGRTERMSLWILCIYIYFEECCSSHFVPRGFLICFCPNWGMLVDQNGHVDGYLIHFETIWMEPAWGSNSTKFVVWEGSHGFADVETNPCLPWPSEIALQDADQILQAITEAGALRSPATSCDLPTLEGWRVSDWHEGIFQRNEIQQPNNPVH